MFAGELHGRDAQVLLGHVDVHTSGPELHTEHGGDVARVLQSVSMLLTARSSCTPRRTVAVVTASKVAMYPP